MGFGRRRLVTPALLAVLALTACGGEEAQDPGPARADAQATIDARKELTEAMAGYTSTLSEVRTTIDGVAGTGPWDTIGTETAADCLEFGADLSDLPAEVAATPTVATTAIPDDRWPDVLAAVTDLLGPKGFSAPGPDPGHDVSLPGPDGSVLQLATGESTLVSIVSGCHKLPASGSPFQTPAVPTVAAPS